MDYVTRKFLEQIFGNDPMKFSSPVVGTWKNKIAGRISYKIQIPNFTPGRLASTFWRLRQKNIIEYCEEGDNVRIILTETGRKKILSYRLDDLVLVKPKQWDGKWRIIAFDIPETKKKARQALVEKMKELGLLQFQKSLWLYPYECKDEIDFIAEVFEVGKYVHYMVVDEMTNDELIRQRFGLKFF